MTCAVQTDAPKLGLAADLWSQNHWSAKADWVSTVPYSTEFPSDVLPDLSVSYLAHTCIYKDQKSFQIRLL